MESAADLITAASERLNKVVVENLPWQRLVKNYDSAESFFFFDPPYLGNTQKSYQGWTLENLGELAAACKALKGKWLVTFGDQPGVREVFKGCKISEVSRQGTLRKENRPYHELIIQPR